MGVGLPYTLEFVDEETTKIAVQYTIMTTLLIVTILSSLLMTLAFFVLNRFTSSKYHAMILLIIYVTYVLMAMLIEFEVIKST